jgi:thiamine-monophosphate kinase
MNPQHHPFTSVAERQVETVGESELISRFRSWLGDTCPDGAYGIGDDCAIQLLSRAEGYGLTTMDGVGYGIHFDDGVPPEGVGRKLMGRNISDIAAMGGQPERAVVSLWLAPDVSVAWLESFYRGMAGMAREFGVEIVGGDVARAGRGVFIADLCLQGFAERPLQRAKSCVGDSIWVTGELGGSLLAKHYQFTPRVWEGQWLAAQPDVHAMIDVSDGLGKDLPALVGAHTVRIRTLPVSDAAGICAAKSGRSSVHHALNDGEDFELAFTLSASVEKERFLQMWRDRFQTRLTCMGEVTSRGVFAVEFEDEEDQTWGKGYEHF